MEEIELAHAACKGDEEAFYALVSLHRRRLYTIAWSYLHNESDALDVLQETVCRAWMKRGKLKAPEAFVPWLIRILINCCVDEQKRRKRMIPVEDISRREGAAEMVSDSKLDLEQALRRMKPKYRHVLILKYYEDMTVPEISKILDCPEGTVKTRLHQGLKLLRQKIESKGVLFDV
ncbi:MULTISPECIES: sigma-70 family RNA polymerase sigma factor [Paenibacillus]|uniref:RNA polymerase subunit sigma n=2 Tax=Paenibacillus campinasensis TaxID=66347 RepID=A0A268EQK0_9BACL|nr:MULTISPECIES: sigma-70 family RNA polymerase sigma factor [Paenibacillus]MUG65388.1 sigma-70 family RNA polymerase sigma factor [Paenibacillus campinasensis]PAD75403.1 RNA polymerase subunit sigma [Paenibacillus campinasensis]PAK49570.1 RNA polymerase subunit sigma [Paenibacillus sp. 7541]